MAPSMDYRVQTAFLSMLHTVVIKKGPRHLGTWEGQFGTWGKTVRHLGPNCV